MYAACWESPESKSDVARQAGRPILPCGDDKARRSVGASSACRCERQAKGPGPDASGPTGLGKRDAYNTGRHCNPLCLRHACSHQILTTRAVLPISITIRYSVTYRTALQRHCHHRKRSSEGLCSHHFDYHPLRTLALPTRRSQAPIRARPSPWIADISSAPPCRDEGVLHPKQTPNTATLLNHTHTLRTLPLRLPTSP